MGITSSTVTTLYIPYGSLGSWSYDACYTDSVSARAFNARVDIDPANMTIENCIAFCQAADFIYAGVEYAQECCMLFHVLLGMG